MARAPDPYRICLVVGQLTRGGLERQAYLLASNLDRARLDVTVISLSRGGAWAEALEDAGVKLLQLERHGRWEVKRLLDLVRLFRRLNPHVVYSFNYETNAYARIAGLFAGVPILMTGERGIYLKGLQIALERVLQRFTECVVTNADAIRRDLIERIGLPSTKVITIRNAVEVPAQRGPEERNAARRALDVVSGDSVVVGTIARLWKVKNLELLLRAAEIVVKTEPSVVFRIVGGGPEEIRLRREIGDRNLEHAVSLLGERPDASALLSGFDVFVLTSHSEGMPNTVMEAMAAGLPCICTDVGGCRELVSDDITGFLVPPGDPGALASRVVALARDARMRWQMGEAGRRTIESEFSIGRLVSRTEELLLTLLAAKDSETRGRRFMASRASEGG